MFQDLWPCNGTIFCNVTNNENCNTHPFGYVHQGKGAVLDLTDTARRRGKIAVVECLNGINDQNVGL